MKTLKNITLMVMVALVLSSCEKVIDLDLNEAEKKYVVEAVVSDQEESARVWISRTKNFDDDNQMDGVDGATVTITDQNGTSYALTGYGNGFYMNDVLAAVPGRLYHLKVEVDGETFTASSRVPAPVEIDSLFVTDELLFGDFRKMANVRFQDPPGRGNCYRFVQVVNNVRETQIMIMNDDYVDGRMVTSTLFYFDDDEDEALIKPGDEIKVYFQMIDAPLYKYWFSLLRSSTGGNQQAAPSNPVSNMRGGALGYFSAHSERTQTIIVP